MRMFGSPARFRKHLTRAVRKLLTERRQHRISGLSEQLSESRPSILAQQFTLLMEAIPDAIVIKDGRGRWLMTNPAAKNLFHLHDIDWQGKTDQEFAAERAEMRAVHERCFVDDEAAWKAARMQVFESRVFDEMGNFHEYELRKVPMFKESGERECLIVLGRDITSAKLAEHHLRVADIAIEAQEGIMITDANNCILRVNRSFTRLTGYDPEEVIGRTPAILKSGRHDTAFYKAMWAALAQDGVWEGEVWDRRKNGEIYPKWLTINAVGGPGGKVTNYVGAFTDLSEHKEAEEAIHRLAFYDPLTDLPNRRLLRDRLQLALATSARNHCHGAVLLIDLDNFKAINDTKGHEIGDLLLVEVAQRLKACVREGDTVARLGGDEFVVMLEGLSAEEDLAMAQVECVGEKILEAINRPYLLAGQQQHSSPSIGISLFVNRGIGCEEILKRADAAMYQAKNFGRNTMHFFDPDMQASLEARLAMEAELRHALPGNQLKLHYQVQMGSAGRILGAEILLRWEHPQLGLIPPAQFIPLAEESGLILPIGDWVLRSACLQLKAWEAEPLACDLQLSVNVSARQFRQTDFVSQLCRILEQTGANAARLKLELTESMILHNVTDTIEKMQALQLLGISFSMDDFGTGYSSLSYLTKLPLNQLKIDQSFVRNITTDQSDAVIAQTIIGMANNLGLNVIAEGVETEQQRSCLMGYGCDAYQGYLFSKPLPLEEFKQLIQRNAMLNVLPRPMQTQ